MSDESEKVSNLRERVAVLETTVAGMQKELAVYKKWISGGIVFALTFVWERLSPMVFGG